VLQDVNLSVEAEHFATISGPSGCGKTTLMKILVGLLEPTSGEVLIDGIPLDTFGPRVYREHIAAVMQEDRLMSGSIAENISFFANALDEEWMIRCAEMACIHDEVMRLPMAYNSLIGDMRARSPAARSSASSSRERSTAGRRSCLSTRPRRIWTGTTSARSTSI